MDSARADRCLQATLESFRDAGNTIWQETQDARSAKGTKFIQAPHDHPCMEDSTDFWDDLADLSQSGALSEGSERSQSLRQEEIRDAGFDVDVIATLPADIQSIFHRTALRRQHSRLEPTYTKPIADDTSITRQSSLRGSVKGLRYDAMETQPELSQFRSAKGLCSTMPHSVFKISAQVSSEKVLWANQQAPFANVSPRYHVHEWNSELHTQDSASSIQTQAQKLKQRVPVNSEHSNAVLSPIKSGKKGKGAWKKVLRFFGYRRQPAWR